MNPAIDISIVMPCLNEARTLPACIERAMTCLRQCENAHGLKGEVVISDNGSTDGSPELAESLGARVVHCPDKGYGNALRFGIESSFGRYVVMGDSDMSYDFGEADKLIGKLHTGNYGLVMGTRLKGTIMPDAMPWKNRYIGNPVLTGILNLLFQSGLSDAHCGMRAFTREAYDRMDLSSPGMEFASEMLIKASLLDIPRTEIPITLHKDGRGRPPHLNPWRDGWRHLRFMFLYHPMGLFIIPGLSAMAISFFFLLYWLVGTTPQRLLYAATGFLLGFQLFQFGVFAQYIMSYYEPHPKGGTLERLISGFTLEKGLLIGSLLFGCGLVLAFIALGYWGAHGFSGLDNKLTMRIIVPSVTLIIMGAQVTCAALFLSSIKTVLGKGEHPSGQSGHTRP